MLWQEELLEIVLGEWSLFLLILANLLFLLLNLILYSKLLILAPLHLGRNHKNIIKRNNNRIIIIQILGLLELLSQQEGILFDHLIDHVFNHSKVEHDIVLSQAMTLLHLFESSGGIIVNKHKDFFNVYFDLVDLLDCCFVLDDVLLVFCFAFVNFLFKFFL